VRRKHREEHFLGPGSWLTCCSAGCLNV
jgi:hypothetical protein